MRSIQLNCPTNVTKMLAEYHMRDKQKEARDRTAGESPVLSVEDELKMNEDAGDANDRQRESPSQAGPQRQPQPQAVIRWERFLPVRSLKVLLVENDDSTRHVVSALLRNCSYEVTAVTNGLEAWKFLEDITNHIDLILTEVVMPCLSGIGLLSKIMNHKTCKNVPVIMMSSNDSMGLVFKCFSKGAVDFLVKPIRKNELKNLWQHVWRKCHSQSSGSGTESGTWTQKSRKSKSVEGSDNNTGSNNDEDNGSTGLNFRDGSDNGSGTQRSWSKRAVEVDSPQPMSPWDPLADPPDRTCAQVIRLMPEAFSNNWVHKTATKKLVLDNELDNVQMGKDLKIGVPKDPKLQFEDPTKIVSNGMSGTNKVMYLESSSNKDADKKEKGIQPLNTETKIGELRNEVTDYVGVISNNTNVKIESVAFDDPSDPSKMAIIKDRSTYDNREIPFIELMLKRQRDTSISAQERNVLRRSDLSAFTRYNTTSIANQAPTGNVGSCSPLNNSSEAAKTESLHNLQSSSDGNPNQGSNGSSNNDMGSTTDTVYVKSEAYSDKPMLKSPINIHPSSAFQLVQHGHTSSLQHRTPDKTNPAIINTVVGHANNMNPPVQVQHHHHHYHHHHHHIHNVQKQKQLPNQDSSSLMNMSAAAPHCGSPDLLGTPVEGNATNYGSASGSNYGSSTALIAEGINVMKDNGVAGKSGDGIRSRNLSMTAVDQNKLSQREATLNKFRQKRKQRNFEKMVRYQSRKKLAEQRPRVRGQFVRQSAKHKDDTDS